MTEIKAQKKNALRAVITFTALTLICIIFRRELSESILLGMKLAAVGVIPGLFPFFVISDYVFCNIEALSSGRVSLLFEKIFG